ncbi:MAG: hypothetical protein VB008_00195 [Candidatus Elulimicrobiales bacterium]|nr:hypothetical protein [Candidatus Elulimicrobiales bacterium]
MGKIALLAILIFASFFQDSLTPNQSALYWAGWVFCIGWILHGGSKKEKTKKKKRYYFEDDDE